MSIFKLYFKYFSPEVLVIVFKILLHAYLVFWLFQMQNTFSRYFKHPWSFFFLQIESTLPWWVPSSAPVERLFSKASLISLPRRNCLNDQKFEELLMTRCTEQVLALTWCVQQLCFKLFLLSCSDTELLVHVWYSFAVHNMTVDSVLIWLNSENMLLN